MSPALLKKTLKGIVTNPIILGIVFGGLWSVLHLPLPTILSKTVSNLGGMATPLGLMAMGASLDWNEAKSGMVPAFEAELIAILVMLGSSTTVSSYVMARNMGHKGVLSASIVAITTLGSAFTLTFWLYVLRTLGLI